MHFPHFVEVRAIGAVLQVPRYVEHIDILAFCDSDHRLYPGSHPGTLLEAVSHNQGILTP